MLGAKHSRSWVTQQSTKHVPPPVSSDRKCSRTTGGPADFCVYDRGVVLGHGGISKISLRVVYDQGVVLGHGRQMAGKWLNVRKCGVRPGYFCAANVQKVQNLVYDQG